MLDDSKFYHWLARYVEPHPTPKTLAKAAWFESRKQALEEAAQFVDSRRFEGDCDLRAIREGLKLLASSST